MDIKSFKKLEKEIENQSFSEGYSPINKTLKVLSFLGNIGSIFLASFFMSKLIKDSVQYIESDIVVWCITLIILGSLEMIKRFVFDKFSLEFVKKKNILHKTVIPLAIFSFMIIGMSFYSSLSGSKEFSSKSENITEQVEKEVDNYKDSITTLYGNKIVELEQDIRVYKNLIKSKTEEEAKINEKLISEAKELWATQKRDMRDRVKQLKQEKSDIKLDIENNESKIKEYKKERDDLIKDYEDGLNDKSEVEISKNESNSLIFIFISTIIEFLILVGIYFNKYYIFRSYKDMKSRLRTDVNFNNWSIYSEIIDILYTSAEGEHNKLPSSNEIWNLCTIQDIPISRKNLEDSFKIFKALKITNTRGSSKYLVMDREEADIEIKKYFKI